MQIVEHDALSTRRKVLLLSRQKQYSGRRILSHCGIFYNIKYNWLKAR